MCKVGGVVSRAANTGGVWDGVAGGACVRVQLALALLLPLTHTCDPLAPTERRVRMWARFDCLD